MSADSFNYGDLLEKPISLQTVSSVPWYEKGYEIVRGFGDSTVGDQSRSAEFCFKGGETIYRSFWEGMTPAFDERDWPAFVENGTELLQSFDPMAKKCVDSSEEYEVAFKNYGTAMTDPLLLTFNVIYHLGELYSRTEEVINFFE